MVELLEIFSVLKFEWAECAAWRSQTVVAAHRRQSATVSGAANINPCVTFSFAVVTNGGFLGFCVNNA